MSKERFTPGPWMAFYKSKYNEWHVSVPGQDETGMRLALFPDGVLTRHPEGDAHLIAAAPEMYEALEDAMGHLSLFSDGVSIEISLRIEKILKKARGEA